MKKLFFASGIVGFVLAGVILAVVMAVPVSVIAIFTAPVHSPELIGEVVCPPGSRHVTELGSTDNRGHRAVLSRCEGPGGAPVERRNLDESVVYDAMPIYYPRVLGLLLAVELVIGLPFMALLAGLGVQLLWSKRQPHSNGPAGNRSS